MRNINYYQNLEACRLNAIQCLKDDHTLKHVIYGHREKYHTPLVTYLKPIKIYNDETFYKYCEESPYEVVYAVHYNEEY